MEFREHLVARQVTHSANGTRYRLILVEDPDGGWIVVWPDVRDTRWVRLYKNEDPEILGRRLVRGMGPVILNGDAEGLGAAVHAALERAASIAAQDE